MQVKNIFSFLGLSIIFVLLTSCSEPKLPRLDFNATILAFGDSLTQGVGSKQSPYPKILAEITGLSVINAGISGEVTAGGKLRFQSLLDKHQPDLIILLEGGNDILRNVSPQVTQANLAAMIEMAAAKSIAIIFLGVPEKKLFSDSAAFYKELAQEYSSKLAGSFLFDGETLSSLLRSPEFKSDPIHLNNAGYRALAEHIKTMLENSGAYSE